jgi:hypothetical protein
MSAASAANQKGKTGNSNDGQKHATERHNFPLTKGLGAELGLPHSG